MSTKFMTGLTLTALAALGLATSHPAAAQTTVTVATAFTEAYQGGPFNLTAIGTTDWINYGNYNSTFNQKAVNGSAVGAISTAVYDTVNYGFGNYSDVPHAKWSDGTSSNVSSGDTGNSWAEYGAGQGFTFNVNLPANSTDIVNVYVGGYRTGSELQVSSGGTQIVDNKDFLTGDNANGGYFSTTFSNTSASSQALTYRFFDQADEGQYSNVKLGSVTLASDPIPSAAPEPSQSASLSLAMLAGMGLILRARKRRLQGKAV